MHATDFQEDFRCPQSDYFANLSLKLTRYGKLCKDSPRYPVHSLELALQSLPPRAA